MFLKSLILTLICLNPLCSELSFNGKLNIYSKSEIKNSNFHIDFEEKLEVARDEAILAYEELAKKIGNFGRINELRTNRIIRELKRAKINWSLDAKKYRYCQERSLAYAIQPIGSKNGQIFICPQLYLQPQDILTQVLIHEAAHFVAPGQECSASRFEVLALNFSNVKSPIKTAYWKECKLESLTKKANKLIH